MKLVQRMHKIRGYS